MSDAGAGDLQARVDSLNGELAAARAVAAALRAGADAQADELRQLRARYESLETGYAALEAQFEASRSLIAAVNPLYERLNREVIQGRLETQSVRRLFDDVGPIGLGVARRGARVSQRFPRCAAVLKRPLRRLRPPGG